MLTCDRLKILFPDPRHEAPRFWSNAELRKFAPLFDGKVVNVSGWKDIDKEGLRYRDYFTKAREYWVTNYVSNARGFQGDLDNEIFLDLEREVPDELVQSFDVVFNHTTLEHVFDVFKAFSNLCSLSRGVVMVVVPFLQEQHSDYGDYWRFSPHCLKRLFEKNGFHLAYLNHNDGPKDSIYVFAVGVRDPQKWPLVSSAPLNKADRAEELIGCQSVKGLAWHLQLLRRLCSAFDRSRN